MKSGNLVVSHHTGWRHRIIQLILVIIAIAGIWGAFYYGQHQAGFNQLAANEVEAKLQHQIDTLKQDKLALKDQLALSKRSNQVDGQAYQQVKDDLKLLQEEILELREEVGFYRGIVSPRESSAGIRIDRFDLEQDKEAGLFHYNLVLTQVLKNDRTVRGVAKLKIKGVQNGRPKTLSLASVSGSKRKKHEFKFRYFQKLDGNIVIPKGFSPRQVAVEVNPHRRKKISRSFEWQEELEMGAEKSDKK